MTALPQTGAMSARQFVDAVREVIGLRPLYWAPEPTMPERFDRGTSWYPEHGVGLNGMRMRPQRTG